MIGKGLFNALASIGKGAVSAVQGFVNKINPMTKLTHSALSQSIGKLLIKTGRKLADMTVDMVDIGAAPDVHKATKILTEINDIQAAEMIYSNLAPRDMIPNLAILDKPLRQPGLYKMIIRAPMGIGPDGEREYIYYSKYTDELGSVEDAIKETYDYANQKYQPEGDFEDYELALVYHQEGYPHRRKQY